MYRLFIVLLLITAFSSTFVHSSGKLWPRRVRADVMEHVLDDVDCDCVCQYALLIHVVTQVRWSRRRKCDRWRQWKFQTIGSIRKYVTDPKARLQKYHLSHGCTGSRLETLKVHTSRTAHYLRPNDKKFRGAAFMKSAQVLRVAKAREDSSPFGDSSLSVYIL